jgi:hypothetical protein
MDRQAAESRQQGDAGPAGSTGAIDAMSKSRFQQLVGKLFPRSWAAAAEAESRTWMVRCRSCGFERSIWELGGVRWKGRGRSATWGRCAGCGKRGWHTVYRRDPTEPAGGE